MQSILQTMPVAGLGEALRPWQKIDWSPDIEQGIYKDWGFYYSRRRRENSAMFYYDRALELAPDDFVTLYHRSQSKRKTAKTEGALADCKAASELASLLKRVRSAPINLEICDALHELNQFENCKVELHDNTRYFTGNKIKSFETRLIVLDENIKDATGNALGPFILHNEKVIYEVRQMLKSKNNIDKRPLWKILQVQEKCDVVSIQEAEEELLSPLEIARRKRAFDVFNQNYLNESWIDVLFLKHLRKNPNLLLQQCNETTPYLHKVTSLQYEVVKKFLKMIQARCPMYYVGYNKYLNRSMFKKYREDFLFRIQYQTRRNMISVLRSIRKLRAAKNLKKLTNFVEEVMGDYVVLKTSRVMPWKFEFLNEVYNTLGLAYAEQYRVPNNFVIADKKAMLKLVHLPIDKSKDFVPFVFGDRSTHQEPDLMDPVAINSRQLIARLEKRMIFARYSIEKCYLLHQIAQNHLNQNRFDECCFVARKAIEETKHCNSYLWRFLSLLLICKAHAALHKVERAKETLEKALRVSKYLRSPELIRFVETCILCNEEELMYKKYSMSTNTSVNTSRRQSKSSFPEARSSCSVEK